MQLLCSSEVWTWLVFCDGSCHFYCRTTVVLNVVQMMQHAKRVSSLLTELNSSFRFASSWTVRTGEPCPSVSDAHNTTGAPFDVPARLLMGPGMAYSTQILFFDVHGAVISEPLPDQNHNY